jgi:hypothetical protein
MEETMKRSARLTVVALALLSGMSVAVAADNSTSKSTSSKSSSPQAMATDTLVLSSSQQKTAWKDISKLAIKEKAPSNFTAMVGAALPSDVATHPVPVSTASKVPALRPYQYAMLSNKKLLIVNPSDKKIADVITQ